MSHTRREFLTKQAPFGSFGWVIAVSVNDIAPSSYSSVWTYALACVGVLAVLAATVLVVLAIRDHLRRWKRPSAASSGQKTILVADQDPVVATTLSQRLQQLGFHVWLAPNDARVLSDMIDIHPALAILDLDPFRGDGPAICGTLASDPQYASIPVIVHSDFTDKDVMQQCEQLGFHCVAKSSQDWFPIKALAIQLIHGRKPARLSAAETPLTADLTRSGHGIPSETEETSSLAGICSPRDGQPWLSHGVVGPMVLCIERPRGCLDAVEDQLSALGLDVLRISDLDEGYWTCLAETPRVLLIQAEGEATGLLVLLDRLVQHPVMQSIPILVVDVDDILAENKPPSGLNLKVLRHPLDWEDFLCDLESFIPSLGRSHEDFLAKMAEARPYAMAKDATSREAAARDMESKRPKQMLRILLIDGDPAVAASATARLSPYGIKVRSTVNGARGFLMGMAEQPDLIVLDTKLPHGDGDYLLNHFKIHPQTRDIPIIVLTRETQPDMARQSLEAGAAAFVPKPVRWPELFAQMGQCVALPPALLANYKLSEPTVHATF